MLVALFVSALAWADPVPVTVDAGDSLVYALVYKDGVASAVAHDHVVQASKLTGSGRWDPADPSASSIEVDASVSGLVPDADALRAQVGLPNTLSGQQRDEILSHILAKYQLWADQYDAIRFRSTGVTGGDGSYQVVGDFTIRGVTKQVTVPMTVTETDEGLRAKGTFRILQSDYGYSPYSALLGALRVKDHVDVHLDIALDR